MGLTMITETEQGLRLLEVASLTKTLTTYLIGSVVIYFADNDVIVSAERVQLLF